MLIPLIVEGNRAFADLTFKKSDGPTRTARACAGHCGKTNILPRVAPDAAEGMIPGYVRAPHHAVFDYPAAMSTIARPGVLKPKVTVLEMPGPSCMAVRASRLWRDQRCNGDNVVM